MYPYMSLTKLNYTYNFTDFEVYINIYKCI